MFIHLYVLKRQGGNVRPELVEEVLRIDLIQRMRGIEVSDWEEACTELLLENEEKLVCQGTLQSIMQALDEVCN